MPNLPLCYWSSQLFDLRAPSSTNVPVLLLNQSIAFVVLKNIFFCVCGSFSYLKIKFLLEVKEQKQKHSSAMERTVLLHRPDSQSG